MIDLPVDSILAPLLESLRSHPSAVLTAEPGAGKTTRVPPALADSDLCAGKQVWVLEPRRVAAMMAATRVAEEKGEQPGESVGYHFRFERAESDRTTVLFLTEGMFLRRLQGNPNLNGVAAVILDEFHERSLDADLALAMLSRLRERGRPDLRLLVMSATLDSDAVSEFLGHAPVIHCPGRIFPVEMAYSERDRSDDKEFLERKVYRAMQDLRHQGDVLIFLPGAAEIRRAEARLRGDPALDSSVILPFHGSLSPAQQRQVLGPAPEGRRKIILATAIAETSLTVPGVRVVIDSTLSRRDAFNPWSGLSSLVTVHSSQASMTQRAGRAGREAPGYCLRLCSAAEYGSRARFEPSEIQRADLSAALLQSLAAGFESLAGLKWLESPPPTHWEAAERLLRDLGALELGALTTKGKAMARAPLHPRLASAALDCGPENSQEKGELCRCLALLSEEKARDLDFWTALKRYEPSGTALRLMRQLSDWMDQVPASKQGTVGWHERLAKALMTAFPDQVAYARKPSDKRGECRFSLAGGGEAFVRDEAAHFNTGYYLLLEILEQKALGGSGAMPRVLSLLPMDEGWLLDCPSRLREENKVAWDSERKRVIRESRLLFGGLLLSQGQADDPVSRSKARDLLLAEAKKAGLEAFCPPEQPGRYLARREFALKAASGKGPLLPDGDALWALIEEGASRCEGFESLRALDVLKLALDSAGHEGRKFLDTMAPKSLRLPSGREAGIVYEPGKPPSVASRLQDFFGLKDTPRIGSQPLSLQLLGPNQRPLQITSDLAGFWEREYPRLRKELSRKYPRHAWPENPV
ncbi:MAG: ATP-dependent helicase HrpB [candidate division FCPU426 bacterium]